jgi:phage terminase small subunit
MPRGGFRIGAGRPRNLKPGEGGSRLVFPEGNGTPLEYMLRVLNDPDASPSRRDRMAVAAAPYVHPRVDVKESSKKAAVDLVDETDWNALLVQQDGVE